MPSASGLNQAQRLRARERATQAAMLALHHHGGKGGPLKYSQEPRARWEGIAKRLNSRNGQYPKVADCSSFVTWCLWNALYLKFGLGDIVNGEGWTGGWTGTLRSHGLPVKHVANLLRGDLVHYGPGTGKHVAIIVSKPGTGVPMVVTWGDIHGGNPVMDTYNYRSDIAEFRRYI
jgi:cell wall-associated NlpC family hydrolase